MPPRRSIRDEDWERLRPTIRKLYLEEDRSLKDVLLILGTFHSFFPSKAQLEWKLKQWHLTKNMGVMDWKYVGNEIHRRKFKGKESKVYLSGIPLRIKAVERGVSRYCYETAIEKAMRRKYYPDDYSIELIRKDVSDPPIPEDQPLLVCTPAPEEMDWPWRLDNIPWLLSRRLIDSLSIKVQSHMGITYDSRFSSSEGLVESILFPSCDLQLDSYTTLLGKTFRALRAIMPEEHEGAHAIRAQCLLQKGRSSTINAEILAFLVFLLSNDLFRYQNDFEQQERHTATTHLLLRLLRESGSDVSAKGLYSSLPPSLQSSLDGLFREAMKTTDLEAVELLLRAGVDVNTTFSGAFASPVVSCGTALQHAASANQPELLQLLIGYGADTRKISIKTLIDAWFRRKAAGGSSEKTMRILLSMYHFRSEDEGDAVHLLFLTSYSATTPVTEALIEFFWVNFSNCSPVAKSQLLITAIRTNSRFISQLVAGSSGCLNSCGHYPETPMTAAVYMDNLQLCRQLLHLGAVFEPGHEAATPLQWAASYRDVSMVEQLIHEGADPNFCHPHPTLTRVSLEHVDSMRLSYFPQSSTAQHQKGQGIGLGSLGSLGKTALHAALLGGNTATALFLLTAGAKLVGGELVMAIWGCQSEIIRSILDRGASFQDECTIFGTYTALEAAILSDNTDLVHRMIAADTKFVTGQALCASICSSKAKSDFTILQHIWEHASHLLSSEDTWVGTAVCLAAHLGCMEISKMMLDFGLHPATSWPIDVDHDFSLYGQTSGFGSSTPDSSIIPSYLQWRRSLQIGHRSPNDIHLRRPIIEIAISLNQSDFLQLLLDHGYHPESTSWWGIIRQNTFELDYLRRLHILGIKMTERVLVQIIGHGGNHEIVDWLLSIGVDVNEPSDQLFPLSITMYRYLYRSTPLQQAAGNGDLDLIQKLINFGADVNEPPYTHGATSLECATQRGFFGIVQRLLQLGANPNAPAAAPPADSPAGYGRTAIEAAAEHGRLDILQLLLNSGVETNGIGRRQYVRSVALAGKEGHYACKNLLKSHAGWTEADEVLLRKEGKSLFPSQNWSYAHTRCYYGGGKYDEKGVIESESPAENQLSSGVESSPEDHVADVEEAHDCDAELRGELLSDEQITCKASLLWEDTCCRIQELTDELDEPSETLLSTFDPISNFPDAYETLSEEVGLEFLPSSMSYQIREELEGDGCLEESGDDLWAEEYNKFVTELA